MKKKLLVVSVLIIVLLVPFFVIDQPSNARVSAVEAATRLFAHQFDSETIRSTATLDDDFADDTVMVVLNRQSSMSFVQKRGVSGPAGLEFAQYSVGNFPELRLVDVEEVTPGLELAETQVQVLTTRSMGMNSWAQGAVMEYDETWSVDLEVFRRILVLELAEPGLENVLRAIRQLERRPDVYSAGPNFIVQGPERIERTDQIELQTEKVAPHLWHEGQWGLHRIQAPAAWNINTGLAAVSNNGSPAFTLTGPNAITVGVMDDGISMFHPDLRGKINVTLSRNHTSDNTADPLPLGRSEGTHGSDVAGVIATRRTDEMGVAGVAYNARLASLRVFWLNPQTGRYEGTMSYVIRAINHAALQRIRVINFSGGRRGSTSNDELQAIENFPGVIVVAAGNDGNNNDTSPHRFYPASHRPTTNNLISVGASDQNDNRSIWRRDDGTVTGSSNFGRATVDIFAPGSGIRSIYFGLPTVGTSMAAPFVAGVAALMLAEHPAITPQRIRQIIMATVDRNGVGVCITNHSVSGGILNAYSALREVRRVYNTQPPTVITTWQQFSTSVRGNPTGRFVLGANLDVPVNYRPSVVGFRGKIDGANFTIRGFGAGTNNLFVPSHALFSSNHGVIKNLNLTEVNMRTTVNASLPSNVGALVGINEGTILNVNVSGSIYNAASPSIGGIVGINWGIIQNARFSGTIEGYGTIGGIAGGNRLGGHITNSSVTGATIRHILTSNDRGNHSVGGIVGHSVDSTMIAVTVTNTTISNIGQISATGIAPPMGRIVGSLDESIRHSHLWFPTATNVTMNVGTLTVVQQTHFNRTQWAGFISAGSNVR